MERDSQVRSGMRRKDFGKALVCAVVVHAVLLTGLFFAFQWKTHSEEVYAELWASVPSTGTADKGAPEKAPQQQETPPVAPEPKARPRPEAAPKQPASKAEGNKSAHENVFFFEGAGHTGAKPLGTLTWTDTDLSFEGKAAADPEPTRLSLPFSRIRSVRQDTYMKLWPLLAVETGDGKTYSFFAGDLPAGDLEAAVSARLNGHNAKRCKYCGSEYQPGDTFCAVCGAAETAL